MASGRDVYTQRASRNASPARDAGLALRGAFRGAEISWLYYFFYYNFIVDFIVEKEKNVDNGMLTYYNRTA